MAKHGWKTQQFEALGYNAYCCDGSRLEFFWGGWRQAKLAVTALQVRKVWEKVSQASFSRGPGAQSLEKIWKFAYENAILH